MLMSFFGHFFRVAKTLHLKKLKKFCFSPLTSEHLLNFHFSKSWLYFKPHLVLHFLDPTTLVDSGRGKWGRGEAKLDWKTQQGGTISFLPFPSFSWEWFLDDRYSAQIDLKILIGRGRLQCFPTFPDTRNSKLYFWNIALFFV